MKEYDLYVPLRANNGSPIPPAMLDKLKRLLIRRFGGLTHFPQSNEGFWKIGNVTFRDKIVILRVLSNEDEAKSQRFWRGIQASLKKHWDQKNVLIVVKTVTTI